MEPYPMRWFRFYDEALNDPKVQQLPDASFKYWINLLCLANQGKPRGRFRREDVAYALRITEERARKMLAFFTEKGLFEEDGDYLIPHGWDARQFQSDNVTERVKKHRGNVARNVSETFDETLPDTEADTEAEEPPLIPPHGGKKTRIKRASAMTETWEPIGLGAWFAENGFLQNDVDKQLPLFRNHYIGPGKAMKDWNATFRNWMLRSREWGPTRKNGNGDSLSYYDDPELVRLAKEESARQAALHKARRANEA